MIPLLQIVKTPVLLVLGGLALLFAVAMARLARHFHQQYRRIVDTPTTPVRKIVPGFVEVKGAVRAEGGLIESPLGRVRCVSYQLTVQEERGSRGRQSSTSWVTVVHDSRHAGCRLDDGTGSVAVRLAEADLELN